MKVYLHSIGCRLNQSEIETLGRQLLAAGHEIVGETAVAEPSANTSWMAYGVLGMILLGLGAVLLQRKQTGQAT